MNAWESFVAYCQEDVRLSRSLATAFSQINGTTVLVGGMPAPNCTVTGTAATFGIPPEPDTQITITYPVSVRLGHRNRHERRRDQALNKRRK